MKQKRLVTDETNNLVAENGRKSQKYAENVIFNRFSVPKM